MDPTKNLTNRELAAAVRGLIWRITFGKGVTPPADRQAAAEAMPGGPLGPYLDKVRSQATAITDAEVAGLRAAGHTDDELFELTVASALGAASDRMEAGLRAIAEAFDEELSAQTPATTTAAAPSLTESAPATHSPERLA